jgi:hypothetical protein
VKRDIEMKYTASVMIDDEKAIKSFEKESRDDKEIHGGNTFSMVRYKSHPFVDFIPG